MVLNVLSNTGKINHDLDAQAFQKAGRANTRKLQNLRAVEGPSGQHNFTFRLDGPELLCLTANELYHINFEYSHMAHDYKEELTSTPVAFFPSKVILLTAWPVRR